ncbi:YbaB/EbfC family nucleoid-associated protein [Actinomadura sp. NAK00032]|uniref:YbaB/EbfC family nucleoid-associated protein n=1 Tax=Actinomadura sp. NAK00032 TaxID=2742128 RepID=UPI0015901214|nr:YbaB/EbfC family nucleoid-associated protein [Actinomadura sp. NAK00032]QKW33601.1 YbaB/EbfC family nucleoid-associated protein [Actinomadura sp. NAK00032]
MDPTGNPEIDRYMKVIQDQLEQATNIQSQLAELSGEGASADEQVRATVGPSGNLMALTIEPKAMRLGSEALAEAVLEAVRVATQNAVEKVAELTEPLLAGENLAQMMTGNLPGVSSDLQAGIPDLSKSGDPLQDALKHLKSNYRF